MFISRRYREKTRIRRLQTNSDENNNNKCNEDSIICLDSNFTKNLLNKTHSNIIGFSSKIYRNKNIPIELNSSQSVFSTNSFDFSIGVGDDSNKKLRYLSNSDTALNNYNYEIRLKIPPFKNNSVIDDTTCTQGTNKDIKFCSSWYDSDTNEVICVCNSQTLISNVENKDFASLSKLSQIKDLSPLFSNYIFKLIN